MKLNLNKFIEENKLQTNIDILQSLLIKKGKLILKSDFPISSSIPDDIVISNENYDAHITIENCDGELTLVPQILTLGIGCRKNKPFEYIYSYFCNVTEINNISPLAYEKICSIDLKKDEVGIWELSKKLNIPFIVFTAEELNKVTGEFAKSSFVSSITGVDNVCERSAKLGSNGDAILHKTAHDGITIAVAKANYSINFEV